MYDELRKMASDLAKKRQEAIESGKIDELVEIDKAIAKLISILYGDGNLD